MSTSEYNLSPTREYESGPQPRYMTPMSPLEHLTVPAMAVDNDLTFWPTINQGRARGTGPVEGGEPRAGSSVCGEEGQSKEDGGGSRGGPVYPFSPTLDPKSVALTAERSKVPPQTRLNALADVTRQRHEEAVAKAREKAMAECTFSPKLTPHARHHPSRSEEDGSLVERTYRWDAKRKAKLVHARARGTATPARSQLDVYDPETCTFSPKINTSRPRDSPPLPKPSRTTNRSGAAGAKKTRRVRKRVRKSAGRSGVDGGSGSERGSTTSGRAGSVTPVRRPVEFRPGVFAVTPPREAAGVQVGAGAAGAGAGAGAGSVPVLLETPVLDTVGPLPSSASRSGMDTPRTPGRRRASIADPAMIGPMPKAGFADKGVQVKLRDERASRYKAKAKALYLQVQELEAAAAGHGAGSWQPSTAAEPAGHGERRHRSRHSRRRTSHTVTVDDDVTTTTGVPARVPAGTQTDLALLDFGSLNNSQVEASLAAALDVVDGESRAGDDLSFVSSGDESSGEDAAVVPLHARRVAFASPGLLSPASSTMRSPGSGRSGSATSLLSTPQEVEAAVEAEAALIRLPSSRVIIAREPSGMLSVTELGDDDDVVVVGEDGKGGLDGVDAAGNVSGSEAVSSPSGAGSGAGAGVSVGDSADRDGGAGAADTSAARLAANKSSKLTHRRAMEIAQKDVRFIIMKMNAADGDVIKLKAAADLARKCVNKVSTLLSTLADLASESSDEKEERKLRSLQSNMDTIANDCFAQSEALLQEPDNMVKLEHINATLERLDDTVEFALAHGTDYAISVDLMEALASVPMFQKVDDPSLLHELVHKMVEETFPPDAYIMKEGDDGDFMCFITRGRTSIQLKSGEEIAQFSESQYFGEIAVLIDTPRTATVKAITYVSVFKLSKPDFLAALSKYPELMDHFRDVARQRLRADLERRRAESLAMRLHEDPLYTLRTVMLDCLNQATEAEKSGDADTVKVTLAKAVDTAGMALPQIESDALRDDLGLHIGAASEVVGSVSEAKTLLRELSLLVSEVRQTVALSFFRRLLAKNHLFNDMDDAFRDVLVSGAKFEVYPFDTVVQVAGMGQGELLFVASGSTSLYMPLGERVGNLDEGGHLGERALLFDEISERTVRSNTDVEIVRLSSSKLDEALQVRPQYKQNLKAVMKALEESERMLVRDVSRAEVEEEARQLKADLGLLTRLSNVGHGHLRALQRSELVAKRSLIADFLSLLDQCLAEEEGEG